MNKCRIYNTIEFLEFYKIVKHLLNEDVWYKIYVMSLPKLKIGDICYFYNHYCKNMKIKITGILYSYGDGKLNNYYSYKTKVIDCECRRIKAHLNLQVCKGERLHHKYDYISELVELKKLS